MGQWNEQVYMYFVANVGYAAYISPYLLSLYKLGTDLMKQIYTMCANLTKRKKIYVPQRYCYPQFPFAHTSVLVQSSPLII